MKHRQILQIASMVDKFFRLRLPGYQRDRTLQVEADLLSGNIQKEIEELCHINYLYPDSEEIRSTVFALISKLFFIKTSLRTIQKE